MGAIAAILFRQAPPSPPLVRTMLDASAHFACNPAVVTCGSCVLGAANGSELADSGLSENGSWAAAFSGTIDNFSEIADLLAEREVRPVPKTPADLVVAAFRTFGAEAPNRLRGTFAAVVTDGHRLWCFRDHLGYRPLHYKDRPSDFFVASEAKQIIAGTGMPREPDLEVLERVFYGRTTETTPSALKGIERLPQATVLEANASGTGPRRRYWNPETVLETSRLAAGEVAEGFSEVFGTAVRRSLTGADVVSLSGGIDSPAVAAYAAPLYREQSNAPLRALSVVFPELPAVDESRYIQLIADYLHMDLHTYTPRSRAWDDVSEWCALFDGPVPTVTLPEMQEYYTNARRLENRNVLRGDMAEFVFDLRWHVVSHLVTHGRWKPLIELLKTRRSQGAGRRGLLTDVLSPFVPGRLTNWYLHARGLDHPERVPDWLNARKVNEVPFRMDLLPPGRKRWSTLQLRPFQGSSLPMESDEICAALSGVTVHRPFADIDVWEFFLSLPAELKFPDLKPKTLMRRLLRGRLPDAILDRRDKTVFDDHIMSRIDYPALGRVISNPPFQVPGVDYGVLAARIDRRDFKLVDFLWVNDLFRIHAFLGQW